MAKILIMDDELGIRTIASAVFRPLGHVLFLAEDSNQALEIARREKLDLAVLDVHVPGMDGIEVLENIKKIDPNIKCIMLTGDADKEFTQQALNKGALDYILKPF